MKKVLTIANQKGGCGKTTIALNLAGALAEDGHDVLVIDADSQGTATRWRGATAAESPLFQVVAIPTPILHAEIPRFRERYEVIIVDCPPGGHNQADAITRSALAASDAALIPVQPSVFDLWSAEDMVTMVNRVRNTNPKLVARFVINRKVPNTAVGREAHEAASQIGLGVLSTEICQRIALTEAASAGRPITAYDRQSTAAQEFRELGKEVQQWLSE